MNSYLKKALAVTTFLISVNCATHAIAEEKKEEFKLTGSVVFDRDGNIYTATAGSDNGKTALTLSGDGHSPKWSPDGQKVLFIRNTSLQMVTDDDGNVSELGQPTDFYIMNRDGTDAHLLKHLDGVVKDPIWSPDGKKIGFFYQSKEEWMNQGIPSFLSGFFEMPLEGNEKPTLVSVDARHVDWSPDGKKLVFTVARPMNHVALHTSNSDGSDETQLLDEETFVNSDMAKWSPNGEEIAFQAVVRRKMPGNKFLFQSTIFTVHPDGTHVHQLTYDLGWDCWHPWWAPNTSQLTYSCYTMPACTTANIKVHPAQCIGRTFSLATNDLHAKPVQIAEQEGVAGTVVPEISAK